MCAIGEEQVAGRQRQPALRSCWQGYRGAAGRTPGAGLEEVLQLVVIASLASARRRDGLRRCDVQLNT
jgi:hypothetical protein